MPSLPRILPSKILAGKISTMDHYSVLMFLSNLYKINEWSFKRKFSCISKQLEFTEFAWIAVLYEGYRKGQSIFFVDPTSRRADFFVMKCLARGYRSSLRTFLFSNWIR